MQVARSTNYPPKRTLAQAYLNCPEFAFAVHYGQSQEPARQYLIIPYEGQDEVYLEGIHPDQSEMDLFWFWDWELAGQYASANGTEMDYPYHHQIYGGTVFVTTWGIDYDIDSDNTNGFNYPDNSPWEEYLEENPHGIGKLIYPHASHFTPTRLRLLRGLNLETAPSVSFDFDPVGRSGVLHVWNTHAADPLRVDASIADGGNRIFPGESYTLNQLGYNAATGGITVFLNGAQAFDNHDTKRDVVARGKPTDSITAILGIGRAGEPEDTVQYMIVKPDTFYPNLIRINNKGEQIRNALAAEGIYGISDLPQYGLRLLSPEELAGIGVAQRIRELMEDDSTPGFTAGLYHDHTSNIYVIAYAGTDDYEDILTDLWQGLGQYTESYDFAMQIAVGLERNAELRDRLMATGHSLGGGLASAAAVAANIRADTFNAAGLLRNTLLVRDLDGNVLQPPREFHLGSLQRYDFAAATLIDAYYLDHDILNFFQDTVPGIQRAVGRRIVMDGPKDFEVAWMAGVLVGQLASGLSIPAVILNLGGIGVTMGLCHTGLYYHWGVMVDTSRGWDIYGYDL